jgi:hypothetical protein
MISTLRAIFQEIRVVRNLPLGSSSPPNDDSIVHPLVLLMTRFDLDVKMKPVLAGVNGSAFHQGLQDLGRSCASSLGTTKVRQCAITSNERPFLGLPNVEICSVVTFDHIVGIYVSRLVLFHQPITNEDLSSKTSTEPT